MLSETFQISKTCCYYYLVNVQNVIFQSFVVKNQCQYNVKSNNNPIIPILEGEVTNCECVTTQFMPCRIEYCFFSSFLVWKLNTNVVYELQKQDSKCHDYPRKFTSVAKLTRESNIIIKLRSLSQSGIDAKVHPEDEPSDS